MATSITHRATGVANYAGTALLAWWLIAAAAGEDSYNMFKLVAGSPIGLLVLFGFTWSLIYHLLNGMRHLIWDTGTGFENKSAESSGLVVIILSIALACGLWVLGLMSKGMI